MERFEITSESLLQKLETAGIDVYTYETIGWRSDSKAVCVGEYLPASKAFCAREISEAIDAGEVLEDLPGTSTFGITHHDGEIDNYLISLWNEDRMGDLLAGRFISIVGGRDAGYGDDPGERLIRDAEILAVVGWF